MNAPVAAPKEFSRLNEVAFRNYVDGELADSYRKSADLIVPAGMKLGFNGTGGEQAVLQFDAGAFEVVIDGLTVISFATDASVATLQANIDAVSASVTSETTARVNGDNALASSITSLTSAYQAADATLQANITSEASTRASADTAIASNVTSLTATVGTNTANIATNATAIATVDGKLSASYGLTADVNGRIAQMKLLSDGTTSSVKFLSTTFQVFNGTTDEAPFEVVGGVVKIKTANIGDLNADNITAGTLNVARINAGSIVTAKLASNAVTQGVAHETDSSVTLTTSYADIESVEVTAVDSDTLIYLPWQMYLDGSNTDTASDSEVYVEITRTLTSGGSPTQIYETFVGGYPAALHYEILGGTETFDIPSLWIGQTSGFDTDQPGAGTWTYKLRAKKTGNGSFDVSKRRFLALLFKR